jgi:transcriptional regulator with XRE-family HTH domain
MKLIKQRSDKLLLNDCGIIRKKIGSRIMQARKELEQTQVKFSQQVGLSQSHLANLEKGKINQIDTLCKIANALNKPISWFFQEEQKGDILYKSVLELQQQMAEMKEKYGK